MITLDDSDEDALATAPAATQPMGSLERCLEGMLGESIFDLDDDSDVQVD